MSKFLLARRYANFVAAIALAVAGLLLMLFGGTAVRHWSVSQPESTFAIAMIVAGVVFAAMSIRSLRQTWRLSIPT